jgi:predicted HicB family RNase H-like nuclease
MKIADSRREKSDKSSRPPTRKATFNLDAKLHQRLKIRAAEEGRGMIELVEEALRKYLG